MNRRMTWLIALVFGGLLALSVLINVARQSQRSAAPPPTIDEGALYPDVQPAAITRIVIRDAATGTKLTLVKVPGEWRASDANGTSRPIDNAQVAKMIQLLATLRYNRTLQEQDVSVYGLAGDGKVSIDFDAGTSHTLRVGNPTQVGDATYVQRDADRAVYLVPSAAISILNGVLAGPSPTP